MSRPAVVQAAAVEVGDSMPVCVDDIEVSAKEKLPREVYDFVGGASGDEITLDVNRAALDQLRIYPRMLSGALPADISGKLLHTSTTMPAAVAPMAYQRLVHPDGEVALASAAARAGIPYIAAALSSVPLEEIVRTGAKTWLQVYWLRERGMMLDLVRRAEDVGCEALVITVDVPIMGRRRRDLRHAFALPEGVEVANLSAGSATAAHTKVPGRSSVATHAASVLDAGVNWSDVAWLRSRTNLPLVVKGLLDPRDAVRAVEIGAEAVVVSNHGGRQFDGAPSSIEALSEVVGAVQGQVSILFDSGVRSGLDVLRALALGADGVLIGRPLLWGLAHDGVVGAETVLSILRQEFLDGLQLAGCRSMDDVKQLRIGTRGPAR